MSSSPRPFWIHQLAQYALGLVLISQGLQMRHPLALALAGVVVLVNAAVVRGPLAAFNALSRPTHRITDVVVILGLVLLGAQPVWSLEVSTRVVLISVAVVMALLWRWTDYREPSPRPAPTASRARRLGRRLGS